MWHFRIMEQGIPERNPRETEFFRVTSPAEAVIREFIQNSLDAKASVKHQFSIKISFNRAGNELSQFLNDDLKQHLESCGFISMGVNPGYIPCLVLEDFGTTGLDGDFTPVSGSGNFYNFWWREGISEKRGGKAGRWGLGKTTFHLVSKIRTFWGLTVRETDGKALLMGKALLKNHTLNNQRYHYFGYFCDDNFMPLENGHVITQFKKTFGITRNDSEAGLSLVIPYPVDEIDFDCILKGVILHYYYPILASALKVEIQEDSMREEVNVNTLIQKASGINWDDTEWAGVNIREVLEFVKTSVYEQPVSLQISDRDNPAITEESFGGQLQILRENFRKGIKCKFNVPVTIKSKNMKQDSFFSVTLARFAELSRPFEGYIRDGILLPEVRILGNKPVAGMLVAEDQPVCEFLGDCETPAHTNWNERTEGFNEKYLNAARILRFIKGSLARIVSSLDEPPHERQVDFLKEIFSVPIAPGGIEGQVISQGTGVEKIKKKPSAFNIQSISGGFVVTLNPKNSNQIFPFDATLRVAYDTRRGNPFAKYRKFDFDLGSGAINITTAGCNLLGKGNNEIKVNVMGSNFRLEVLGFDPNRDLLVEIIES